MIEVHARCLLCGYRWITALVDPQSWWGKSLKPEKVARIMNCPRCDGPAEWATEKAS